MQEQHKFRILNFVAYLEINNHKQNFVKACYKYVYKKTNV